MALSKDIREKVVKAIAGGMSASSAAARFDIGPATAVRWAKRALTTGDVAPMKMGGEPPIAAHIEAHAEFILKEIKTKPDTTIMELRDKLRERHGLSLAMDRVAGSWRGTGSRARRRRAMRASQERETSKLRVKRGSKTARFRSDEARVHRRNQHLDEYGASLRLGVAQASAAAPRFVRTLEDDDVRRRLTRRPHRRAMTIDGALDGEAFRAYVEQLLAPTLSSGDMW